jgi:hypothetical protein
MGFTKSRLFFLKQKTLLFLKPHISTVVSAYALGQPDFSINNQIYGYEKARKYLVLHKYLYK